MNTNFSPVAPNVNGIIVSLLASKTKQVVPIVQTKSNVNISKEYVRSLIKKHLILLPKELNKLYPEISIATFRANYRWLKPDLDKFIDERIAEIHKLVSTKNNSYIDKNHFVKEENRNDMANMVYESGLYGRIASLSHIDCLVERKLDALTSQNTFVNIDRDELVVEGAKLTMYKYGLNGNAVCGDMLSVLKNYGENDFAHIFMDFCGALPIQGETLDYVIKNNLVKVGGYIFLTVSNAVRKVVNGYSKEYNSYTALHNENMCYTKTHLANKLMLNSMMRDKFIEVKDKPYQTDSPMLFYVMQRYR